MNSLDAKRFDAMADKVEQTTKACTRAVVRQMLSPSPANARALKNATVQYQRAAYLFGCRLENVELELC